MNISSKYLPLWNAKYRYAIISGGRGSGKSFSTQAFLRDLSYEEGHKIVSTRYTMVAAERSVIPEFASKFDLDESPYGGGTMTGDFSLTGRTFFNNRSGSEVSFMGLKTSSGIQTASLKSIEGLTCWMLDEAEELVDDGTETKSNTFDSLDNSIRTKGRDLRTILTWNPSSKDSFVYKRFFEEPNIPITHNGIVDDVLYVYTTYHDNIDNLHESFAKKAENIKIMNPARYEHIYLGYPIAENALALWKKLTMLSPFRVAEAPEMERVIVAVDPSVSESGGGDECGIFAMGKGHDGHFYILRDESAQLAPADWGLSAAGLYHEMFADNIIAESNNGGGLVTVNIRVADPTVPVKLVHASKGKMARAEPVSALYLQGKVHHVGQFPELEQEMCSYTGAKTDKSPNRLDALVWGLTELANLEAKGQPKLSISFL